MAQFWLSFCDTLRPKGSQFLGAAIVHAEDPIQAVMVAWDLEVNPGGEVAIWGPFADGTVPIEACNRLLTREEAEAL